VSYYSVLFFNVYRGPQHTIDVEQFLQPRSSPMLIPWPPVGDSRRPFIVTHTTLIYSANTCLRGKTRPRFRLSQNRTHVKLVQFGQMSQHWCLIYVLNCFSFNFLTGPGRKLNEKQFRMQHQCCDIEQVEKVEKLGLYQHTHCCPPTYYYNRCCSISWGNDPVHSCIVAFRRNCSILIVVPVSPEEIINYALKKSK
jgi:hypothetical protein